jgi:CheY-like chemotaxis protein
MADSVQASTSSTHLPKPVRGRILIADDYQAIREIVRSFLERRGFDVSEAADGGEAIRKMESVKPDLVVLDLAMPQMNGVEVASVMHQRLPRVPIVALTMYEQFFAPMLASIVGVSAVVSKANGMDKLVECVESLLSPKQAASVTDSAAVS